MALTKFASRSFTVKVHLKKKSGGRKTRRCPIGNFFTKKRSTYGGYTLRSLIEAPLITREVLPETYFLLVTMAADAQAHPFLQFQASC